MRCLLSWCLRPATSCVSPPTCSTTAPKEQLKRDTTQLLVHRIMLLPPVNEPGCKIASSLRVRGQAVPKQHKHPVRPAVYSAPHATILHFPTHMHFVQLASAVRPYKNTHECAANPSSTHDDHHPTPHGSTHPHACVMQGADTPLVDEVFLLETVHKR
jgi:hypothetical protein